MTNEKRKGISPIIATVLLIAITIAAGLAIYGWVSGLISAGTSSKLTGSTPLTLTLESATISNGEDEVVVAISNQGAHDVPLSINNIQIVSSAGYAATGITIVSSTSTYSSTSTTIPAGSTTSVTISFTPANGDSSTTFTLSIVGATDTANEPVIANSISFTV